MKNPVLLTSESIAAIQDGTSADMEGYAARLSDAEIWNVVNYVRTHVRSVRLPASAP